MKNPWEEIPLEDYENHMKLDSVLQLQSLNEMMKGQFQDYPFSSIMILGIAGGNGLEHIRKDRVETVYGVDVNAAYLKAAAARHPELEGILECIRADLTEEPCHLPEAELLVADLLIEYVGLACFQRAVERTGPAVASCVIQVNSERCWVSDSPYSHVFDGLGKVHHHLDGEGLEKAMRAIGYRVAKSLEHGLPNGKKLLRMDFQWA
nr:methyltransferase type 11 [uncultured Oscillibacter sp.]